MQTLENHKPFGAPTEPTTDLAFSIDGKQLASLSESGRLELWDLATGTMTATLHCGDDIYLNGAIAFSPHRRLVMCDNRGLVQVFEPRTWDTSKRFKGRSTTNVTAWTPRVACAIGEIAAVTIFSKAYIWKLETETSPKAILSHLKVEHVAFSPGGELALVSPPSLEPEPSIYLYSPVTGITRQIRQRP